MTDNGSKDGTLSIARHFKKKYPGLVHYVIENKIQSSYAARNRGVELSKGKLLSFIDADMTVKSDLLEKIVSAFDGTWCSH